MKNVIRVGDPTSHGGKVLSTTSNLTAFGKPVALVGDQCICPIVGHVVCVIVEGDPHWSVSGRAVALSGCKTSCGASLISTLPQVASAG